MTRPADDVDRLARRLLLLSALAKTVAEAKADTKDELHQLIRPGTTLRPVVAGKPAGSVSYTVGRVTAAVTNEQAFADWVLAHEPGEVDLVVAVKPEYRKAVLDASEQANQPCAPTGECGPDAPAGIRVANTAGALSARPDPKRAAELWHEIRTSVTELVATRPEETP
jgi:hypothetical protein